MPRLPRVSGRQAIAAFERAGFQRRRHRGSHIALTKRGHPQTLSVPDHRQLGVGLLRDLIRKSGLTVDQFVELLSR
jgi:predicted RNA binding protein YcfA (HicA-like mRNA interferase family)